MLCMGCLRDLPRTFCYCGIFSYPQPDLSANSGGRLDICAWWVIVGVKRRFLSFLNSSANAKMAFFIVFPANFFDWENKNTKCHFSGAQYCWENSKTSFYPHYYPPCANIHPPHRNLQTTKVIANLLFY